MDNNEAYNNQNNSGENSGAIVSMILGILSVVLCWVPIIGLALGIVGLILSVNGMKKAAVVNKGKGFSIAGLSCGSVGIVLNIVYTFVWIFMGVILKYTYDEIDKGYNNYKYNYNTSLNRYYDRNDYNSSILDFYDL